MKITPPEPGQPLPYQPPKDLSDVIKPDQESKDLKDQKKEGISAPKLVSIEETKEYKKDDPPLLDIKITNPVTYLKLWLRSLLRNEGIDIRVRIRPLTAIAIGLSIATFFAGTGFSVAKIFFPSSSPILKREISYQGTIQKADNGSYYLLLTNGEMYRLTPKTELRLDPYLTRSVMLRGNLTREPNVINVSEVTSFSN